MKRIHAKDAFVAHVWTTETDINSVSSCVTVRTLDKILAHSWDAFPDPMDKIVADVEAEAANVGWHNLRPEPTPRA